MNPSPLLTQYINHNYDLRALSRATSTPIPDLLTWLADPQIKQTLTDLRTAATDALTLRATEARRTAIDALEHVLRSTDDPIEKRRAATALLRALNARPQRPEASSTPPNAEPRIPIAESIAAPIPSSPEDVVTTALRALSRQAALDPDEALATLHACCAPTATINDEPIAPDPDDFLDDAEELREHLVDHVQVIYDKPEKTDTTYTQLHRVIHYAGRTVRATFTLQPSPALSSPTLSSSTPCNSMHSVVQNKAPWRITALDLDPIETGFR